MRLIDADALITRWKAAMLHMTTVVDGKHPISIETLIEDVEKFPTIDPESLRPQGKWIMRGGKLYCSRCGEKAGVARDMDDFWYTKGTDYCPNCGAKMYISEDIKR